MDGDTPLLRAVRGRNLEIIQVGTLSYSGISVVIFAEIAFPFISLIHSSFNISYTDNVDVSPLEKL